LKYEIEKRKKHESIAILIESVNRDRGASREGRWIFNFLNTGT